MKRNEAGQALIFAALGLTVLLGFAGLAIDMGALRYDKRLQQSAADAAAIAGASNLAFSSGVTAGAQDAAATNGFTDNGGGQVSNCTKSGAAVGTICVEVNNPPLSGPHTGNANYVEVLVSAVQPTFFMKALNITKQVVTARAVATNLAAGTASGCLYTLGTSGTGILLNGSITAASCGIMDDANMVANGSATVMAASIGVSGTYSGNPTTPAPVQGVPAAADPLNRLNSTPPPVGSCTRQPAVYNGGGTVTLNPGNFCRGITVNGSASVTFTPGVYVISGGQFLDDTSGTFTGREVMFYNSGATITLNGSNQMNFSAPTTSDPATGAVAGVLFWQAPSDTNTLTLNGGNVSSLEGIVYAPDAPVTMNGSNAQAAYTIIVAQSLLMNGSNLNLAVNTSGLTGGSPIKNVVLVE
jgi:Putative Flp pilus-assembly TadE/G-like